MVFIIRINSCIKKKRKIEIEYGLNCVAVEKFRRIISEKALDKPVLTVCLVTNEFIGCGIPDAEKIAE